MSKAEIVYAASWSSLSSAAVSEPFAVLLDTRDSAWSSGAWVRQQTSTLIQDGCRYFVCFGPESEQVHDWIDDEMLDREYDEDISTTFHADEPIEDVANFFRMIAMQGMKAGVVLARDEDAWRAVL